MKSLWLAGLVLVAWPVPALMGEAGQTGCDAYLGTWEYAAPSPPGRVILAKHGSTKYLAVWIAKAAEGGMTEGPKVGANAGAWEATCEGSRLRWKVLFATDPAEVGKEYVQEGEVDGDQLKFWTVGAEGTRQNLGAGRRLR